MKMDEKKHQNAWEKRNTYLALLSYHGKGHYYSMPYAEFKKESLKVAGRLLKNILLLNTISIAFLTLGQEKFVKTASFLNTLLLLVILVLATSITIQMQRKQVDTILLYKNMRVLYKINIDNWQKLPVEHIHTLEWRSFTERELQIKLGKETFQELMQFVYLLSPETTNTPNLTFQDAQTAKQLTN